MSKVTIDRELLERIGELMHIIAHRQDDYGVEAEHLGGLLKKAIAQPAQQGEAVEAVEVRGLQWLDTGHYRKKPPQFGYNPHDWNPLMTVAQHQRILAASVPAGCKVVPVEPTQAMIAAGWKVGVMGMDRDGPKAIYSAMLASAGQEVGK